MNRTKIEWCDSTWNPVTGCYHDCEYCYARRIACRFSGKVQSINHNHVLNEPWKINGKANPYPFGFTPTLHRYRLNEFEKKKGRTIFVCSMADLFGSWVPDSWIEEVFAACQRAPQHRYMFLTKAPERLCELANKGKLPTGDNFWYGSTITGPESKHYLGRITDNTFLSIEPLLAPLNVGIGSFGAARWIIIGAETGKRKGKIVPCKEWIDNIYEAASLTHAAVFMKDSLIPIVGEENMRREFPDNIKF